MGGGVFFGLRVSSVPQSFHAGTIAVDCLYSSDFQPARPDSVRMNFRATALLPYTKGTDSVLKN